MGVDDTTKDDTTKQRRATAPSGSGGEGDVGKALRTVYQKTVEEKVPDEFLDLLGKLG